MKKKINEASYFTLNENAQYFECGYSCDNGLFLKLKDEQFFITDARYTLEAKQTISQPQTQVIESSDLLATAATLINKSPIKHIIFDPHQITLGAFERLKGSLESKKTLEGIGNFCQTKRIIKTKDQIKLIKKSQKLNKEAYKNFAKYLNKHGHLMREQELYYRSQKYLTHNGTYRLSFEPILGINANAAKPHALPSPKVKLKYGDLLLFDAGIAYKRYCSDRTRTGFFGKDGITFSKHQNFPDKELQKIYDIVLQAQEKTIKLLRSGMSGKQIDGIAREVIDKAGYGKYFIHSTGHGIGLDIHELPFISKKSETIIEDGMVFSIEPGIYIPNRYGVRIEDLVVVEDGRAVVL
ncbi:X-Pro aminopeptidase [Helicobacter sp. 12S02634-8]|uniref:aminopeptidase P family protein n=1 Tax=Helicobacter sp. 12S02634-8 TaxID=1476199 RepID=UPI000BCA6506|nr:aminopeptidase P family protein [Helicobacter sp. 12S02634-8]PAF47122.1 X-Pro aminopeptidase [Helicobacter sp. 12S02634-8]